MQEKAIPRHDYLVVDAEGNEIGKVNFWNHESFEKVGVGLAQIL